jgi:predicted histidine transporter YuiF (NhaC family)
MHDLGVFDALKKSIYLVMNNLELTVKGLLFEVMLFGRFILNAFIVIAIPLGLIYLAVFLNIIDNAFVETIIRISAGVMILVISYINGIFEAFFANYRYQLFQKAEKSLNEEPQENKELQENEKQEAV